jgi:hypothetical protein
MSGFVYFLGPDDWRVGKVKIGYTVGHPNGRLAGLQTGCPFKLAVYGFTPGDFSLERALHETFASLRQHGEWFDMEGKLLSLVSCLYFDKYGRLPHTEKEFGAHVGATVCSDEPPHPTFCSMDRWMDSADSEPIGDWLHDRAWAAYQAERAAT